jgi:hypothetical protein
VVHLSRIILVLAVFCATTGCRTYGPASLRQTHPEYNRAVSKSLDEQFLLNLVRLKYRDNPFFLEVSSITTQQSVEKELSATVKLVNGTDTSTPVAGLTLKETPTISYTPLHGDQFLKQILSPVPLEAVLILTQSGWSIERVFSVCVERANNLDNASNASGPTPAYEPPFRQFKEMASILRVLQIQDAIELGAAVSQPVADGNSTRTHELVLRILPKPQLQSSIDKLKELLGLEKATNELKLTNNILERSKNSIALRTRSMMGILFHLSHNTQVPIEHEQANLVSLTKTLGNQLFDWNQVTGNLLRIRSSSNQPESAAVAVPYRGAWFYLADSDLESKSTFMLLTQLFNLQAGQIKTVIPALTIGVGG